MARSTRWPVIALALVGACDGRPSDGGAEEAKPPTVPAAHGPQDDEAERQGIPIRRPPPPGPDWRAWATEHSAALRADIPELHAALVALPPTTTRGGSLRLVDPRLHHPAVAPVLLERLLLEPSPELRAVLAEALPATGGHFAMALAELIAHEPAARVRVAMAVALARGAAPHALEGLALALRDADPEVRLRAVAAVAERHDGATLLEPVIEALRDEDPRVRHEAARSLGSLRDPAALPELAARLDVDDPAMRLHALRAVSRIDPSRLDAAVLERLATDPDPKVSRLATRLRAQALALREP